MDILLRLLEVSPEWAGAKIGKVIQGGENFIHANYHLADSKMLPPIPFAKGGKSSKQRIWNANKMAKQHIEKRSGARGLERYYNTMRIHGGKPGIDLPDSIGMYRLGKQAEREGRVKRPVSASSLQKRVKKLDDAIKRMNMGRS